MAPLTPTHREGGEGVAFFHCVASLWLDFSLTRHKWRSGSVGIDTP